MKSRSTVRRVLMSKSFLFGQVESKEGKKGAVRILPIAEADKIKPA